MTKFGGWFKKLAVVVLSWLSRTTPGKIVFVSFHTDGKFYGNVRALYEHLHLGKHEFAALKEESVFITPFRETEERLRAAGLPVERRRVNWLKPLLGAEFIIVDAVPRILSLGKWNFVQLWHGTGFKNIELLDELTNDNRLQKWLSKKFYSKTKLLIATSEEDKVRKEKSFASTNVVIVGSPRNDQLVSARNQGDHQIPRSGNVILYAPTFRSQLTKPAFSLEEWRELDSLLARRNLRLLVKLHPADRHVQVPDNLRAISDVTNATEDVQDLMADAAALVTDYSGIASDFVLTGRPIIFYTYDIDEYLRTNRTFYYNLKELLPGPFASTFPELSALIADFSWFDDKSHQMAYKRFQKRMHDYVDGQSCERALRELAGLLQSPRVG